MVELNQSCPCKSGLKYRECCLPFKGLPKFLTTGGMCNEFKIYAERYTLNTLLKKSKEFRAFYISERTKIVRPVIWGVDPSLSVNMRTGEVKDVLNLIILKSSPIHLEDAFDAAHELRHLLLAQEGFPRASITDYGLRNGFDTSFATILLNSVMDPLVNSGLVEFGFDLWGYFDKASQVQRHYRETLTQPPLSNRQKYFEVSLYIQKMLDWEIANRRSPRPHDDFLEWFNLTFPIITQEATEILNEIRLIGYDTPEKVRLILTRIIEQYNMSDIIALR
ncbi:MAG TPA: SEC-C domain-containing protein [Desulfosporosinus sp.]|nr:SEC-C domain-containing protein [Desulfosporosinus sp.]